jgi:hypothetical protein
MTLLLNSVPVGCIPIPVEHLMIINSDDDPAVLPEMRLKIPTRRNAKLIGQSIDPVESHGTWVSDIEETQTGRHRGHLSRRLKSAIATPATPLLSCGARHGALDMSVQQQRL